MGELQVADVKSQVALSLFTDFGDGTTCDPAEFHRQSLDTMLDQVVAWAAALRPLRIAT